VTSVKILDSLFLDVLDQNSGDPQRIPEKWCSSEFIDECVGSIYNRAELNDVSIENIISNLRLNMQKYLKIPLT
jgi:hypothetical protein